MAQFSTLLPVLLLLLTVFNPIVCPRSKMNSERRDRAPYIESNKHSPQYLADAGGLGASRSRKVQISATSHQKSIQSNDEEINERIESVFDTKFGPGLHLFKNTAPNGSPSHFDSLDNEYMHADQPQEPSLSSVSSPTSSPSKPESFKVQRSPTGNLNLVFPESSVTIQPPPRTESPVEREVEQTQTTKATPSNHPLQKPRPIYFPTEEPEKEDINYTVNYEDCVEKEGESFCTTLRNYPEKTHLEQIIKKKYGNLELLFGEDLVLPQNISQRMNNQPAEEFLCKSHTKIIYPQAAVNKDYNWLIIVNIPNYKQGIRIEECDTNSTACGKDVGFNVGNGFKASCEQNYIYRSLVAVANGSVVRDQFRMPSCCKCVVRVG